MAGKRQTRRKIRLPGVLLTMVNGIVPYRNGEFTHRRGGRFLEKI